MNTRTVSAAIPATILATALTLTGCVTTNTTTSAPPVAAAPQPPRVYFYPQQGQSPRQQERDRYDCFNWASTRTAFDPSRQPLPRETREVVVVPAYPPGSVALAGAATGALVGATVSDPWHRGEGALIGAVAGTMLGAVAESAQKPQLQPVTSSAQHRYDSTASGYARQAAEFRRAMSACLEGRGYAVK
jgi:outer membrane lipoprotein SlyB